MDAYVTLAGPASARLTRERSRFLAFVEPTTAERVLERVDVLRREHHDATHVCFAYRVRARGDVVAHADDAGEPKGSAGLPILQQIEAAQLVDVVGVVVRHFGGVKLGVGGLVRAYGDAMSAALAEAVVVERFAEVVLRIRFPHGVTSAVMRGVHRHGARVLDIRYDTDAEMRVAVVPSHSEALMSAIREETGARASVVEET